jgi:pimeloyl-ACP methyl ester carboxylesterase
MGPSDCGDASDLPARALGPAASRTNRRLSIITRRPPSASRSRYSTRYPCPACTGLVNHQAVSSACCSRQRIRNGSRASRCAIRPHAVAAAMHHCFEDVDTIDILPRINAPVLLLSGDKNQISPSSRRPSRENCRTAGFNRSPAMASTFLLPERCAQAALTFWNSLASAGNAQRRAGDIARLV